MAIESVTPSNHLIFCRPLLLLPSIFPSIRVFSKNWFFASDGQSIGVSASTSLLPVNVQDWFPLGLTGWISLESKDSQESSPIPQFLTCLLRNLYAGQEATVRTGHGTIDWFQIGKGVCQDCILSPYLFNFYTENIMWNARLDEAQARIKITGRNINNHRYTDDTTFMAESEEELKSLLMKVREESEKLA